MKSYRKITLCIYKINQNSMCLKGMEIRIDCWEVMRTISGVTVMVYILKEVWVTE